MKGEIGGIVLVDKKKRGFNSGVKPSISKISTVIFLAIILLLTGLPLADNGNNVAQAAPTYKNPDARGSGISYIKKSDFTGTGYNKSRGIHPGDRGEGYTCWANGNVNSNIKSYSNKFFFGNKNRTGGRGNEAFVETHGLMNQCSNGKKLIEYEVYAGDAYKVDDLEPVLTSRGILKMWGWSALGGYDHNYDKNSSTYAVAIEQVNGRNTTKTDGIHITKAGKRKVDMTHALSYGGLETCYGDATNRFRGSYMWSSDQVRITYGSWPFKGQITDRNSSRYGNVYDTYGAGCNFNYREAGFVLNINLNDLFKDKTEKKDYKMYLVKRVNDMIVSTEMAIPNDTTTYNYGYGKLELDGNAITGNNTITVNRTGVPKCGDFKWGIGCQKQDGNGFFRYGERVQLLDIQSIDGNASIYTFRASNGKVYKHLSNYFSYSNDNRGAVLSYTPETVKVDVNHLDIASCNPSSVDGKPWSQIRTQKLSTCDNLREKSTGKIAKKGTKELPMKSQFRFYTYNNGELYKNSRNDNYRLYDSKSVMSKRYEAFVTGIRNSTLNFFYVNQADLNTVRINYRDVESGNYLYGKYKNSNERIRGYMQFNNVLTGRTIQYKNPSTVIGNDGRLYERTSGSNTRTSMKVNDNVTLNINYRKQPIVQVRYINEDTGRLIRQTTSQLRYGEDFRLTAPNSMRVGGTTYYHFNVDREYSINNVTRDRVLDVYYKDSPPQPYPEDRYELVDGGTQGGADVGDYGWRLNENRLETTLGLTFDGVHADAENATIKQYVGEGSMPTSGSTYNNDTGMYKTSTANVMNNATITDENDFNKDTLDKYLVNVEYDYTNVLEENYLCDDGVDERCFEWVIDTSNPNDPYWGENGETVTIDGSSVTPRQTYTGNLELTIENNLGEEFDLEELPEEMIIGKGLGSAVSLYSGDVANDTINDSHPSVVTQTEGVEIEPNEVEDLETQSSITVLENIAYNNTFGEDLPTPKEESRYFIGNIDKNLEESMEKETVEEEDYVISNLRLDGSNFKLDNVFGLSNKYGVQIVEDYSTVSDDETALDEELTKQLDDLNLGADKLINMNYNLSRYFLPVDDVKYNADYVFKDLVELNSLGLNEVTVNYDKEFGFDKFLYGNVMDEPVYTEQKEGVKKETYENTETFTQEELQGLMEEPERTPKFNLFRATDDKQINNFLN